MVDFMVPSCSNTVVFFFGYPPYDFGHLRLSDLNHRLFTVGEWKKFCINIIIISFLLLQILVFRRDVIKPDDLFSCLMSVSDLADGGRGTSGGKLRKKKTNGGPDFRPCWDFL